jgi:hypothetical protein
MSLKPYQYVRFRWWNPLELNKVNQIFDEDGFATQTKIFPHNDMEISLYKKNRVEVIVKSDTLTARLSDFRAVLYQVKAQAFTRKDMKLREKVFEIYTKDRPTPFPWSFRTEPRFETKLN